MGELMGPGRASTILVTGANGQLGSEIAESVSGSQREFIFTDVDELDISELPSVEEFIAEKGVGVIINCAAYNAVDRAEEEEAEARRINSVGPGNLARAAGRLGAFLVHLSTDFVFDGGLARPYRETDVASPLSVYGQSKLDGEIAVGTHCAASVTIRTSWLYSSFGSNFVKTILRLAGERDELGVVFDQVGTPTYARDLAGAVLTVVEHADRISGPALYHYSNEGMGSWYDLACAVVELASLDCRVYPIPTSDYPLPAARPSFSVLDKGRIKEDFLLSIPYWRDSLRACLEKMGAVEDSGTGHNGSGRKRS